MESKVVSKIVEELVLSGYDLGYINREYMIFLLTPFVKRNVIFNLDMCEMVSRGGKTCLEIILITLHEDSYYQALQGNPDYRTRRKRLVTAVNKVIKEYIQGVKDEG